MLLNVVLFTSMIFSIYFLKYSTSLLLILIQELAYRNYVFLHIGTYTPFYGLQSTNNESDSKVSSMRYVSITWYHTNAMNTGATKFSPGTPQISKVLDTHALYVNFWSHLLSISQPEHLHLFRGLEFNLPHFKVLRIK